MELASDCGNKHHKTGGVQGQSTLRDGLATNSINATTRCIYNCTFGFYMYKVILVFNSEAVASSSYDRSNFTVVSDSWLHIGRRKRRRGLAESVLFRGVLLSDKFLTEIHDSYNEDFTSDVIHTFRGFTIFLGWRYFLECKRYQTISARCLGAA
jgi:hypothetical protein